MAKLTTERKAKIDELKEWFGWDNELIKKLTPGDLTSAYKIMLLERMEKERRFNEQIY